MMFRKEVAESRCVFSTELSADLLRCLGVIEIHLIQTDAPSVRSTARKQAEDCE
jgi:hypothetical protein